MGQGSEHPSHGHAIGSLRGQGRQHPDRSHADWVKSHANAVATANSAAGSVEHRPGMAPGARGGLPTSHTVANVRVFSDLGESFNVTHAEHLKRVWDYFNGLYRQNRGPRLDIYYTQNAAVFQKVIPNCPTIFIPGARNLTACYLDYPRWFIIPYQIPDLGTQIHEIGHDFLFATWPGSEDSTWYKEGTAMYFEGGSFRPDGSLFVPGPLSYCTILFRRYDPRGIFPLNTLIRMSKSGFLADAERTYSQSCMFFSYLQAREPVVLPGLIDGINTGRIRSNDQLIDQMISIAGKSLSALEGSYLTYSRQVS
jgi:hypothetical protein